MPSRGYQALVAQRIGSLATNERGARSSRAEGTKPG